MTAATPGLAFLLAFLMVATALRSAITAVGPLLGTLQADLGLSATTAGVLASLPLLLFAAFAPLASLARSYGSERLLVAALAALVGGILLRSQGHVVALFGGTMVLAGAIAVANILLPTLVKQHFPDRIPTVTTAYATVLGVSASAGSGLSVPLAGWLGGWQAALASWALPALLALLLWAPHARRVQHQPATAESASQALPWRSGLAWQVTGYMGLQSLAFYTTASWYPTLLQDLGYSADAAGWYLSLYMVAAMAAGLAVPWGVRRLVGQHGLGAATGLLTAVGILGVMLAPGALGLWMVLMGIGTGPAFVLALSFMGLRAANAKVAAALSLMAQALGYLIAASGPVCFGYLHDATGGWTASMLFALLAALVMAACGYGAGRVGRSVSV
jgi:MFS transporter, CP family, cyanate transporter